MPKQTKRKQTEDTKPETKKPKTEEKKEKEPEKPEEKTVRLFEAENNTGFLALTLSNWSKDNNNIHKLTDVLLDVDSNKGTSKILLDVANGRDTLTSFPVARDLYSKLKRFDGLEGKAGPVNPLEASKLVEVKSVLDNLHNRSLQDEIKAYEAAESTIVRAFTSPRHFKAHLLNGEVTSSAYLKSIFNGEVSKKILTHNDIDPKLDYTPLEEGDLYLTAQKMTEIFNQLEKVTMETNAQALKFRSFLEKESKLQQQYKKTLEGFLYLAQQISPETPTTPDFDAICNLIAKRREKELKASHQIEDWLDHKFATTIRLTIQAMEQFKKEPCKCCKDAKSHLLMHCFGTNHPLLFTSNEGGRTAWFTFAIRFIDAILLEYGDRTMPAAENKPWPPKELMDVEVVPVPIPDDILRPAARAQEEIWPPIFLAHGQWVLLTDDFFCIPAQNHNLFEVAKTDRSLWTCYIPCTLATFHFYLELREVFEVLRLQKEEVGIILPKYAYYSPGECGLAYDYDVLTTLTTPDQWKQQMQAFSMRGCFKMFLTLLETIEHLDKVGVRFDPRDTGEIKIFYSDCGIHLMVKEWWTCFAPVTQSTKGIVSDSALSYLLYTLLDLLHNTSNYVEGFADVANMTSNYLATEGITIQKLIGKVKKIIETVPLQMTILYASVNLLLGDEATMVRNSSVSGGREQIPQTDAKRKTEEIAGKIARLAKNKPDRYYFIQQTNGTVYYLAFNETKSQ